MLNKIVICHLKENRMRYIYGATKVGYAPQNAGLNKPRKYPPAYADTNSSVLGAKVGTDTQVFSLCSTHSAALLEQIGIKATNPAPQANGSQYLGRQGRED